MKHSLVLVAGAVTLAACNKGPDINVRNAGVGEVAQKVREAAGNESFIAPGKWRTRVTLLDVEIPGMPAQMARQMKESMARMQEHGHESCLTEADVKRPKEDFFAGKSNECRYDHFTMSGGKIDAVMRCEGKGPGAMTMTINGTYSRDSYSADMSMDVRNGREGGMRMRSRSEARRIGECTGKEDNMMARKGEK